MAKYTRIANELQKTVLHEEQNRDVSYTEEQVKSAIVHARHDIVLTVSYLHSLNKQIRDTKYILSLIFFVLIFIAFKS